ncbi:hypothetical protein KK420_04985 [Clostridioides difficile]|nr:hypothetical protein [Clostridioides difficile]
MKIKITITMVIAISLTLGLITGCTNKISDTNEKYILLNRFLVSRRLVKENIRINRK